MPEIEPLQNARLKSWVSYEPLLYISFIRLSGRNIDYTFQFIQLYSHQFGIMSYLFVELSSILTHYSLVLLFSTP